MCLSQVGCIFSGSKSAIVVAEEPVSPQAIVKSDYRDWICGEKRLLSDCESSGGGCAVRDEFSANSEC